METASDREGIRAPQPKIAAPPLLGRIVIDPEICHGKPVEYATESLKLRSRHLAVA